MLEDFYLGETEELSWNATGIGSLHFFGCPARIICP